MFEFKPFVRLNANGFHPIVVSLSNDRGRLLDGLLAGLCTKSMKIHKGYEAEHATYDSFCMSPAKRDIQKAPKFVYRLRDSHILSRPEDCTKSSLALARRNPYIRLPGQY